MGEASEMLGGTARTFHRWRDRYGANGRLLPRVCPHKSFALYLPITRRSILSEGADHGNAHDIPLR